MGGDALTDPKAARTAREQPVISTRALTDLPGIDEIGCPQLIGMILDAAVKRCGLV